MHNSICATSHYAEIRRKKPKQFPNNYSDVLQMPFKLAENINFVSTQDRKAHLYSTCNYSTHNIIAVITKYGT